MSAKVCYITAIYGNYEVCTKIYPEQTMKADFICFTNNKDLINNNWILDYTPYHFLYKSDIDDDLYVNSLSNNIHNNNIAKYYKQQFYKIPRLKNYDIIIWLDGSMEIYNPDATAILFKKMESKKMIAFEHFTCYGLLSNEVIESAKMSRYTEHVYLGQIQPIQDIIKQYQDYLQEGYDEEYFKRIDPNRQHLGVYAVGIIGFQNNDEDVRKFLDLWYLQTLKYTLSDQIGFSYTAQKLNMVPYPLPDEDISGNFITSTFHMRRYHGTYS
jgi:hypothetical protein